MYNNLVVLFCQLRVDCATRSKVYYIIGKYSELAVACGQERNATDKDGTNTLDIPIYIHIIYLLILVFKEIDTTILPLNVAVFLMNSQHNTHH